MTVGSYNIGVLGSSLTPNRDSKTESLGLIGHLGHAQRQWVVDRHQETCRQPLADRNRPDVDRNLRVTGDVTACNHPLVDLHRSDHQPGVGVGIVDHRDAGGVHVPGIRKVDEIQERIASAGNAVAVGVVEECGRLGRDACWGAVTWVTVGSLALRCLDRRIPPSGFR